MHIFFAPDAIDGVFQLPVDESVHCMKVLRFKIGQEVNVTNGKGLLLRAVIENSMNGSVLLRAKETLRNLKQPPFRLHLAISPLKNPSRFEWFVEKATEFGVTAITPLMCNRTEKKGFKTERIEKIVLEAMKQSKRVFQPLIMPPIDYLSFVSTVERKENAYIAWCSDSNKVGLSDVISHDVLVLIGPEGDFTSDEVETAIRFGYIPLSLGEYRLRTETAGIAVASHMNSQNEK